MKVVTLVGARPQFVKAAAVSRAFEEAGIEEVIVHSGQHYDQKISQIFFDELGIPEPTRNLHVGSGPHGAQTGEIMAKFEAFLLEQEAVDWVMVYGDTNTTLAGALVAAKLHIPVAHIEAGLRSYNRKMPEEINRIMTDCISDALFCPTDTAIENLQKEGVSKGVYFSGDVMYDATLHFSALASQKKRVVDVLPAGVSDYFLATVHRASNTDNPEHLKEILKGLGGLPAPVVLPLHPRTRSRLAGIALPANILLEEPVGYLEMLTLIKHARGVLTDSGGLQKEAYWLQKPCITLRDETEWVETLEGKWNQLVGANAEAIVRALDKMPAPDAPQQPFGQPAEGSASDFIAGVLLDR